MKAFRQPEKRVSASDVVSLLREVYPQGVRGRSDAEALIAFDREFSDPAPEWQTFIATAIADHLLRRVAPAGIVTREKAEWLIGAIAPKGTVATAGGVEILLRTVESASAIPATLSAFAIREVCASILFGRKTPQTGQVPFSRALAASDVAMLKQILVAAGNDGGAVTLEEAEALFDLHDAIAGSKYHAAFDDLFFRAITSYLVNASGGRLGSRVEALAQEPRRDAGLRISAEAGAWLGARIMRDGMPTMAERALLALIERHAEPDPADRRSYNRAA